MRFTKPFVLCLLIAAFAVVNFAQTPEKPLTKAILADIIAKKAETGPFVLLTPEDLAGYSAENLGDPCNTAAPITFGQTINGSLAGTDCQLDDSTYADFYTFNGTSGQQVTISLNSSAFDAYLGLANMSGTFVIEDDDSGGGTNARIAATLPETGAYIILANSVFPNSFGGYSLNLSGTAACTYSINPSSANIPGLGSTYTFSLITQQGCQWGAVAHDSFITINTPSGNGPATISYTVGNNTAGTPRSGTITVGGQTFTVTQESINCTYSITPTSVDVPAGGVTADFTMNTAQGCPWIAYYNDWWIWTTNDVHYGPGPATYYVQPNNGADRVGTVTVAGNTFTVRQPGLGCTYSVSPVDIRVSPAGQYGDISVQTQPGCTWSFSAGASWVEFPNGSTGTGPGTATYRAYANNTFAARTWTITFNGVSSVPVIFRQGGIPYRTAFDFFGDSKVDLSVYRPSTGQWYIHDSQFNGNYAFNFGSAGDIIAPGDYNGDRMTEMVVFRPGNGSWYFFDSVANTYSTVHFGSDGDVPVPADYDGDGITDIAVFRPSASLWYIRRSADGSVAVAQFGVNGDAPVAADYDGDGKADIAIWRPSVGEWWIARSSDGAVNAVQFGQSGDKAVAGDYTGDGKTDVAIFRPSNGFWYVLRSEDYSYFAFPFGTAGDMPAPGDYDADGITDPSVFRPSNGTWYVNRSGSTVMTAQYGTNGDLPVAGAFVR
ncbi:MAG TPA: FG-GAP-like repeat-containing protein [Pyrinomonadaceae bacterium]|nr:FG-GAP-like repeat-containing protein [Pyrinomonadaceae bacterium]